MVMLAQLSEYIKKLVIIHFKMVNFLVYKLYLNRAI